MTRLMETVESQRQAPHWFPQPLGNLAKSARFPHSLSSGNCEWEWKTNSTTYRCFPRPWVTSLSDPTDTRLGYLIK